MVELSIINGDLYNMGEFDLSMLNGLLSVCSDITITKMGIHLWFESVHVSIFSNVIVFLGKRFVYDEIIISYDVSDSKIAVNFVISTEDREIYFSVVSDVC